MKIYEGLKGTELGDHALFVENVEKLESPDIASHLFIASMKQQIQHCGTRKLNQTRGRHPLRKTASRYSCHTDIL